MMRRDYYVPELPKTFSGLAFCLILGTVDLVLFLSIIVKAFFR